MRSELKVAATPVLAKTGRGDGAISRDTILSLSLPESTTSRLVRGALSCRIPTHRIISSHSSIFSLSPLDFSIASTSKGSSSEDIS